MSEVELQRDVQTHGDVAPAPAAPASASARWRIRRPITITDYDYLLAVLGGSGQSLVSRRVEDEYGMAAALAEADWDIVISDNKHWLMTNQPPPETGAQ